MHGELESWLLLYYYFLVFFFLERVRFMKSIIRRRRAMPRKAAVALWNLGGENIKEMKDCTPREERVLSDEGCGLLL